MQTARDLMRFPQIAFYGWRRLQVETSYRPHYMRATYSAAIFNGADIHLYVASSVGGML